MKELSLSMRVPLVASNELAIVTKSIAFVSPPRTTDNLVENCHIFEWWEKYRRVRKEGVHLIKSTRCPVLVEEQKKRHPLDNVCTFVHQSCRADASMNVSELRT